MKTKILALLVLSVAASACGTAPSNPVDPCTKYYLAYQKIFPIWDRNQITPHRVITGQALVDYNAARSTDYIRMDSPTWTGLGCHMYPENSFNETTNPKIQAYADAHPSLTVDDLDNDADLVGFE